MEQEKEDRKTVIVRSDKTFNKQLVILSKEYNMSEAAVIRISVKNEFNKFNSTKTKGDEDHE